MFFHFVLSNFSNTYLLGPAEGGNAVIIDPGVMDLPLLNIIEQNDFYVKHILVTHNHASHVNGIKTLRKIYDADVYSNMELPFKSEYTRIEDGDQLELNSLKVDVINIPGHSPDSMIFKIKNMLFTGDVLLAGEIDHDLTIHQASLLKEKINEKIFVMDDDVLVFPGHGAPSTVKTEKFFNPYLRD
ncbi:MAG: MBL fold metallo-hydrolase [Spirochaetales bacterium]|uniref:MBL fold metallo-hydrolase n=1 Tax=Candidatus Thalassospirochaeta sargassi TaxID=3119039 RepID=A0AAJ1MN09_9SPIO|nr:MBL fold metallo-hydrolase [Spirochaetales bacterium]